jgi:hypothetical protein
MKHFTIILIMALAFCGCQTLQTPEGRLDRERVIRALDTGELFFGMGLNFAELRGADKTKVQRIRVTSAIAFDLVRDALAVNLRDTKPEDLGSALLRLRLVVNDALVLCDNVGVNPSVMAEIRIQTEKVFVLLESLITALPEKDN